MQAFAAIVALCAGLFVSLAGWRWWTNSNRHSDQITVGIAILILLASTMVAAAQGRAAKQWSGPDLPFSCEFVRSYRAEINAMSAETRAAWSKRLNVTRKQKRQALACLKAN